MKDTQKWFVAGLVGVLGILGLSRLVKGAGSLFDSYMQQLTAATTRAELDAIRYSFEGDYYGGKLTYDEYVTLYNFYLTRIP